jgi:hypothetical protein
MKLNETQIRRETEIRKTERSIVFKAEKMPPIDTLKKRAPKKPL